MYNVLFVPKTFY